MPPVLCVECSLVLIRPGGNQTICGCDLVPFADHTGGVKKMTAPMNLQMSGYVAERIGGTMPLSSEASA